MSVYPRGDRSRSQFFVDEEVLNFVIDSERLASSCRCWAHGTLVVPAIVAWRTPRLMTSLGNNVPLVDEEGYPYLVRIIELLVVLRRSPLALARCRRRSRANLDNFLGFRPRKPLSREALPNFGLATSYLEGFCRLRTANGLGESFFGLARYLPKRKSWRKLLVNFTNKRVLETVF